MWHGMIENQFVGVWPFEGNHHISWHLITSKQKMYDLFCINMKYWCLDSKSTNDLTIFIELEQHSVWRSITITSFLSKVMKPAAYGPICIQTNEMWLFSYRKYHCPFDFGWTRKHIISFVMRSALRCKSDWCGGHWFEPKNLHGIYARFLYVLF